MTASSYSDRRRDATILGMPSRQPDSRRVERLEGLLASVFADSPTVQPRRAMELVRAPGRVILLGEHTDYNDGFALSVSIDLDCWVAFRRRTDGLVRIVSCQTGDGGSFWIDQIEPKATARSAARTNAPWVEMVEAVAWSLRESGVPLHGIDAVLDSTIPMGIGLGASAALELACAQALCGTDRLVTAPVLAALAQRAEREYLGIDTGIKDQFACAAGREERALLLDCRSLETKQVGMPRGLRLVVCDTGTHVDRDHATFRERRVECSRAIALLSERVVGLCSLRDLDAATLKRHRARLPDQVARRAEHVIAENARVLDAAVALGSSDLGEIGRLFAESHASLRDLYDVGSPEIEATMRIAATIPGVVASRMAGPGLGGCTLHLVLEDAVPALVAALGELRPAATGRAAGVYSLATADGAGKLLGVI
jgi:galactokinase